MTQRKCGFKKQNPKFPVKIIMKDYRIVDLKDFLEIADSIESVFKFYEMLEDDVKATVWLRVAVITYEGKKDKISVELLKDHNFKEIKELETRQILLTDLV